MIVKIITTPNLENPPNKKQNEYQYSFAFYTNTHKKGQFHLVIQRITV